MHETFWSLLRDPAHWCFELFLMGVFDLLIGAILWPRFRQWTTHHRSDDNKLEDLERRVAALEAKRGEQ